MIKEQFTDEELVKVFSLLSEIYDRVWNNGMFFDPHDATELGLKTGLLEESAATESDCETDHAKEFGVEIGDPLIRGNRLFFKILDVCDAHEKEKIHV